VTDGVALGYDTGVLRDGGAGLFTVAGIADAATQALQAAPLDPVMFGLTPGAPGFAAAVAAAGPHRPAGSAGRATGRRTWQGGPAPRQGSATASPPTPRRPPARLHGEHP
jgi:hypothetical protein